MALKVKVGGEVGYLDRGDIVELAAHLDLDPFRRGHELRFADASRGLCNHRLFAAIIWRGDLCGFSKSHGCLTTVKVLSGTLSNAYFMRRTRRAHKKRLVHG